MHAIYHFTKRNGELPGEFLVISDNPESVMRTLYETAEYCLDRSYRIAGNAASLPTDRPLRQEY